MCETIFKGSYVAVNNPIVKRALLVIDLQNEYFSGKLPVCYPPNTLPKIMALIATAQKEQISTVVVQHTAANGASAFVKGTNGWELHDALKSVQPDFYVEKGLPSAFVGTNLQGWLDAQGIDTVVISGYMTQFCCDSTAKHAMHLGYNVEFLSDATATLGFENSAGNVSAEELHRAILVAQAARFSHVLTTEEWIKKVLSEVDIRK